MTYCATCGAEYREGVSSCADCGGTEMVSREELKRRGVPAPDEWDTRKLLIAGTAEDPLTQELLVSVLEAERIPVFARPRHSGAVAALTGPGSEYWELMVAEEQVERARGLVDAQKAKLKAGEAEAAQAAEDEAGG